MARLPRLTLPGYPHHILQRGKNRQPICAAGEMMVQTTLWFGLNRPHGAPISAAEWQNFVDKEVTPRFSDGLSVIEGDGHSSFVKPASHPVQRCWPVVVVPDVILA